MAHWTTLGAPATVVLVSLGSTASADVTPAQVWESWQDLGASMGQILTAESETAGGGSLMLTGVQAEIPIEGGTLVMTVSDIEMSDQGDGTVAIFIPDAYSMAVEGISAEGDSFSTDIMVSHENLVTIASGDPGAIDYSYSADSVTVTVDEIQADDETVELGIEMVFAGLAGSYNTTTGPAQSFDTVGTADALTLVMGVLEPGGGGGSFTLNLSFEDLETESSATMLPGMAAGADLAEMVASGFNSGGYFAHGNASYEIDFSDGPDQFSLDASATGGGVSFGVSEDGLSYGVGSSGLAVAFSGSEIPLPQIAFQVAESDTEFSMPIIPSDDASPFAIVLRLIDFTTGEDLWSMVDPSGALPRDPASVILDISGMARLTANIFGGEEPAFGPPGEFEEVSLNEFLISAIGAQVTGSGAFDVDNSQPGFAPGMPKTSGAIDLQIQGANGLIDNLVGLGLLPQDQAMGARMMMGLFARPGEGPDSLVSKIEITEDGQILANGQRIQ